MKKYLLIFIILLTGCSSTKTMIVPTIVANEVVCDDYGTYIVCEDSPIIYNKEVVVDESTDFVPKALPVMVAPMIYRFAITVAESIAVDIVKDLIVQKYKELSKTNKPVIVTLKSH